jgi:hypothetical protein
VGCIFNSVGSLSLIKYPVCSQSKTVKMCLKNIFVDNIL